MKPAPIISVINSAAPAQVKASNAGAPEQSFGQVLAQQVQGGAQANKPAPAQAPAKSGDHSQNNTQANSTANSGAGQSAAGSSTSSGSSTTTGTTASNTAGSTSGSTPSGKTGKTKSAHGQDDSESSIANNTQTNAASDASANNSAQILALVSNVQQAAAATSSTTTDATAAVSALTGNAATTSAQAALANFQASIAGAGKDSDAEDVTAAATDEKSALPDAFTKELVKNLDSQDSGAATTTAAATQQQTTQDLTTTSKAAVPAQPALDLAASVEKDLQAGLANLDDAAAKTVTALQSASSAASAALPGIATMAQTNVAAQVSAVADKLEPQVGSNGWDTSLGQKVVWMAAGGQQSASLTLNPPDLGPMQVVLSVTNSHATVNFTAAQPEVRQALENALPKLREMLGDAGIQLGQASVNAGNAQQQQFADQGAQKSSSRVQLIDGLDAATPITSTVTRTTSAGNGLVDTFA